MTIQNLQQAKEFFYHYIPTSIKNKFAGEFGLERTKYLLKILDNPQEKIKVIHIAGTTGKGSTAYITSAILHHLGFKVGLQASPHIIDFRERFQINNQLISEGKLVFYLNEFIPYVKKVKNTRYASVTYFEVMIAFMYYIFFKEKVDYAVIETGMGGMWDGTNIVASPNKFSLITKIGFDHTKILGNTLSKITQQKAGIIQEKNTVIALWQKPVVNKVISQTAKNKKALLIFVKKNFAANIKVNISGTFFDFSFANFVLKNIRLNLLGFHQVENASIALTACAILAKRDNFVFNQKSILKALDRVYCPGRMEVLKIKNKTLIVDGAHNPQKMSGFTKSLKKLYPNKEFIFLIAFKKDKDIRNILPYLIPLSKKFIITDFTTKDQDIRQISEDPQKIKKQLIASGFKKNQIIADNRLALKEFLSLPDEFSVITGSLYLLSSVLRQINR